MKKFLVCTLLILNFILQSFSAVKAENVIFNTSTYKVHKLNCSSAKVCTKNCVKIERSDAYKRGGKSCKKCGG